jgi:hypothetical protein
MRARSAAADKANQADIRLIQSLMKRDGKSPPKHRSKASPVSRELRCCCVWVGWSFGGFLDLYEKIFFLSIMSGGLSPPRVEYFFFET